MNYKTITALLLAIFMVGTINAQTQQRPSTQLDGVLLTSDPIPLQSGEDGDISFKIVNKGDTAAEDVEVEILDRYPFELKPDRQRNYSLSQVSPGEAYYISTEVLVNEEVSDGTHELQIRVSNNGFSQIIDIPVEVQSQDIELNLANLQTSPSELMPDTEDNKLTLEVVNNGEKTAENVEVNLEFPEFFEKTSSFSTRQSLGNIDAGQVKTADFNFDVSETAPKGAVDIPATISYSSDDSSAKVDKEEVFETFVSGKPQFEIINYSSSLKKSSSGKIEVEVKNIGEEKSTSTRIRVLDSSDLPFSYSSSSQFIGTLEPGSSGSVVFDVTTESDAEVKQYLLDFEVRGVKDTEVFTEDKTLDVAVEDNGRDSRSVPLPVIVGIVVILGIVYIFRDKILGREK